MRATVSLSRLERPTSSLGSSCSGLRSPVPQLKALFHSSDQESDLVYIGEINSAEHSTKQYHPSSSQFGLFAATDLNSDDTRVLGEYVGLVDTQASKDASRAQLSAFEQERSQHEFQLSAGKVPIVIDAFPFCNAMSFLNSYRGIAEQPNACFMQVCKQPFDIPIALASCVLALG